MDHVDEILTGIALVAVLVPALPILILFVECGAACLHGRPRGAAPARISRPSAVLLVPAHDEEELIGRAIANLKPELAPGDRLVVVAHNCGDRTAEIARAAGAVVVEARDAGGGGKPDALKAGLRALDHDPPEVVVIVDADCTVSPGSIDTLARAACEHGGPVQGIYLFAAPEGAYAEASISSLALLVKNLVRPLGLARLGLPCLLHGSGSAYPFEQIRQAPHGEGSIAEDYQLAIDLAREGHPTRFELAADVRSALPERRATALRQRTRWEHGHLVLCLRVAPGLILEGLREGTSALVVLGIDLLVPPLAFLALGWAVSLLVALLSLWKVGTSIPLAIAGGSGALFTLTIFASALVFAGSAVTGRTLLGVPRYVVWKLPMYLRYLRKREQRWTKTERGRG
jgi:cellulose synthase/poly-beta-1,6-N-acetylglucosamine synthase-like glycosyltransferase